MARPRLSKSRVMSALQCPKRVYLEIHQPELARYSARAQAAFALGHEVGAVAVELYGGDQGTYVDYRGGGFSKQLAQTASLMSSLFRGPIFEATLRHDGVLVREDVLLPVGSGDGAGWRVVEVKASTRVKPEHVQDCAVQAWVHTEAGFGLDSIALAHVDRQFTYAGDGDYQGLLREEDLTDRVQALLPAVPDWVARAREAAAGPEPAVAPGHQCRNPYECPFMGHCWPGRGDEGVEYPLTGLGGGLKRLGVWLLNGYRDLRDVPAPELQSEIQQRIQRVTREGRPELLEGAGRFASELPYPRFYLDFETIGPAVPVWPGTRPYQVLPVQWSCHIERAPGHLEHREFLDLGEGPPMRRLAEALIEALEENGPVLMYTDYERRVIAGLAAMYPDLGDALKAVDRRLVDLHPVTKANYYHPDMLGSWSIKAVLPTIAPDLDYAALEGIREGTEASSAYLEAIDTATPAARRNELRRQLLDYCRHDTEAMVRLLEFFAAG
jgi:hypothetical protein